MKFKTILTLLIVLLLISGCGGDTFKFRKVDAREFPPDPKERIKKNMEEGRGFRLSNVGKGNTNYDFANSNPLWRATLDTLDFMPLVSANYSGGVVITDWYSENNSPDEAIKISVRFLTNEIRSDALNVNIFIKECEINSSNCKINKSENELSSELTLSILKKAASYEKERIEKYKKENPYTISTPTKEKDKKK
ncbi:DUF3576 domain-containing protein [Candidatus Pelagibacter communis]|uniref:DUF3576 domain-containing protein n=1 Tax=Candidatus Pelagibacter TaxID=198251 RepID=UPI003EDF8956